MTGARPERLLGAVVALVAAGVVVAIVALSSAEPADTGPSDRTAADGASPVPGRDGQLAEVERVVDGDTLVVLVNGERERVRHVGIDAPELADPASGRAAECGGDAALEAHADLVAGARLLLERDVSDRDRFGRLLRHARLADDPDRLVGEELVAAGVAEARSYPPDTRLDARFEAAEQRARDARRGIWGRC